MKISHIKILAKELKVLMSSYVSGEISEKDFMHQYPVSLNRFEEKIDGDGSYHPLDCIVPTSDNSENAWKENMITMYKNQLKELESTLDDASESYSEMLGSKERKKLCKEGLKAINNQVIDIVAHEWIKENLVEDFYFEFLTPKGVSKFGDFNILYTSPILQESFLLSALSNVLVQPDFSFQQILNSISGVSTQADCFWAQCSEVDGAIANVKINSYPRSEAFNQLDQLAWIEHTTGGDVQWGDCHLLLMPVDNEWMLKITNNFKEIKIEIHGGCDFLKQFDKLFKN